MKNGYYWLIFQGCNDEVVKVENNLVHKIGSSGPVAVEKYTTVFNAKFEGPIKRNARRPA